MNKKMWFRLLVAGFIFVGSGIMITGCESDSDSSDDAPAEAAAESPAAEEPSAEEEAEADVALDMTGAWSGDRTSSGGSTHIQMTINHSGSFFSGGYTDGSGYQGTIDGLYMERNVGFALTLTAGAAGAEVWQFRGELNEHGNTIVGVMTLPAGDNQVTLRKR